MKPEPGDTSIHVMPEDVTSGFAGVGVALGDTLVFHSSLSSMGTVVGGADGFVKGALAAAGDGGTVAAPTLWYCNADPPRREEDFLIDTSPSYVGAISEAVRKWPGSVRSNNFSHSMSAIGRRAAELTCDHGAYGRRLCPWGDRAFAEASPWQRLYDWDATICFIGVTFLVNTMRHFIEALIVEETLRQAPADRRRKLADEITTFARPGIWPHHDSQRMGQRFEAMGLVRLGNIGSATVRAINAHTMVDAAMPILRAEPDQWFGDDFLEWLRQAKGGEAT